jgi:alkyl hydroperoxide reductase subunit AhpC
MIELGELERHHEQFANRNARVIVASVEGLEDAAKTKAQFPHLLILADHGHGLSDAAGVIHPQSAPGGSDTSAPTTVIVDSNGVVRWIYRSNKVISRLSPDEVLQAVDTRP